MTGKREVADVDWMPEPDILAAYARGLTLHEIAELNYEKTGDQPARIEVLRMLQRLGVQPRAYVARRREK